MTRENFLKITLKPVKKNRDKEISLSIQNKFKNKSMREFWNEVRNKKSTLNKSYTIDGENNNKSILNVFTNKFLSYNLVQQSEENLVSKINEKINSDNANKLNIFISGPTMGKLIMRLNKGAGDDGIHSSLLKNASDKFIDNLVVLFNLFYRHSYLPFDLLRGDITPIIKNKRKSACVSSNYRPIMISSSLLKLFEMHILEFLKDKIKINGLQFGYADGLSTTDACLLLKEVINANIGNKSNVFCKFIDLSSAFDTVDHFLLAGKLLDSGLPISLITIICYYLRNQSARITWQQYKGQYKLIESGVRQGGILSPFLFNFYINEILNDISLLQVGCKLGLSRMNVLAYADDMVLLANNIDDINLLYTRLQQLTNKLNLKINENKSKCIIFRKSKYVSEDIKNKILLEVVDEFNYLGHLIQYNLDDTSDINLKLNNFYASFNSIYRNFSIVDFSTFLYLFNTYCAPIYGLQLWCCPKIFNKSIFKVFNIAYSNSLKRVIGCSKFISSHWTANILSVFLFHHRVALIQAKYFKRIIKLKNNSIFLLNRFFIKYGCLGNHLISYFYKTYNINVLGHDMETIESRITWLQLHNQ